MNCNISGPHEVQRTKNESKHPYFDITVYPKSGAPSTETATWAKQLSALLEEVVSPVYSRKQFTITLYQNGDFIDCVNSLYRECVRSGIHLQKSFWGVSIELGNGQHNVIWSVVDGRANELLYMNSIGEFEGEVVLQVYDETQKIVTKEILNVRKELTTEVANQYIFS
ncbi:hypothetical protein DAMA08_020370 [Martiniozyma asiatica (nom. inval.)]|nr:hypothetical protein DAMA08_020370 [Martiniozyma asiatica]